MACGCHLPAPGTDRRLLGGALLQLILGSRSPRTLSNLNDGPTMREENTTGRTYRFIRSFSQRSLSTGSVSQPPADTPQPRARPQGRASCCALGTARRCHPCGPARASESWTPLALGHREKNPTFRFREPNSQRQDGATSCLGSHLTPCESVCC